MATGSFRRMAAALVLFGISFGLVEASVVVYLRAVYEPLRERYLPGRDPRALFPLLRLEQLRAAGPRYERLLAVELMRELATMVLLASIGVATGRRFTAGLAAFAIAFGIWDIGFYAFLKLLIRWPATWLEWDLLFLIPAPWSGPVLAPLLVSGCMVAGGFVVLWREEKGRPVRGRWWNWMLVLGGAGAVLASFLTDAAALMQGGMPKAFSWSVFASGLAASVAGLSDAVRRRG